jgi:hypothetical protein
MGEKPGVGVSADKVAEALEKWLEEEIKGRTARYFDLGKFLFSVSTGVLVFFVAARKALGAHQCSDQWLLVCVAFAVIGVVASLVLIWPRNIRVGPSMDIVVEFNATLQRHRLVLSLWYLLTVGALLAGGVSLIDFDYVCKIWQ